MAEKEEIERELVEALRAVMSLKDIPEDEFDNRIAAVLLLAGIRKSDGVVIPDARD